MDDYIFDSTYKKKILIDDLGIFLFENSSLKLTKFKYNFLLFKKNFISFNKENLDTIKDKSKNCNRLTFIFSEKSQKGLLKQVNIYNKLRN